MKDIYFNILDEALDILGFYAYLIEQYGQVKAVQNDFKGNDYITDVYHDYIYFCFTKTTRSLLASVYLAKNYFREDTLIILRSVYETYLRLSSALKNPNNIQEYVFQQVGLQEGLYKYKIGKKSIKYNILVDSEGNSYNHNTSIGKIAQNTLCSEDDKIHKPFYKYLSEHCHSNMLSSGNYRTKSNLNYCIEIDTMYLEVPFSILYFCLIIGECILYYHSNLNRWNNEHLTTSEYLEFTKLIEQQKVQVLELISQIDFSQVHSELKDFFIERVNQSIV